MNITAYAHKFFLFGGGVLIAIGVVQLLSRPRSRNRTGVAFRFDARTVQAIVFLTFGVLTVLAGLGVISMTGGR
jgi:hypothetical protein